MYVHLYHHYASIEMENKIAKYINVNGCLMDLEQPKVMGILNVTPDSFYAGSRKQSEEDILLRARQIIDEGGEIIDIGAYSSRPDAQNISTEEEASRLKKALTLLNKEMPEAVISVDTFRADIAGRTRCGNNQRHFGRKHGQQNDACCGKIRCTIYNDAHERHTAGHAEKS